MNDQELLKLCNEYLSYNQDNGNLTWIKKKAGRNTIGVIAGGKHRGGYISLGLKGRKYLAHRIAFLMYHKYLPNFLDHINGIKSDNRIINLRECTLQQNNFNLPIRKSNTSGYKGVSFDKSRNKFAVRIQLNGRNLYIGRFTCKHDAAWEYNKAALRHFGEFAHLNVIQDK